MRNIKFRAWEKELKEIIPVYNIDFQDEIINKNSAWRLFSEVELMQCTELKDKDGIEIYEGDVLEKDTYWSIRIDYSKGSFMVRDLDRVRYANKCLNCHIDKFSFDGWKVVGNIYANPELLV